MNLLARSDAEHLEPVFETLKYKTHKPGEPSIVPNTPVTLANQGMGRIAPPENGRLVRAEVPGSKQGN